MKQVKMREGTKPFGPPFSPSFGPSNPQPSIYHYELQDTESTQPNQYIYHQKLKTVPTNWTQTSTTLEMLYENLRGFC